MPPQSGVAGVRITRPADRAGLLQKSPPGFGPRGRAAEDGAGTIAGFPYRPVHNFVRR